MKTAIGAGSGFTSIQKTGRTGGCIPCRLSAGSNVRPAKTRVNSVLASRDLKMAGNVLLFLCNGGDGEDVAFCLLKEVPKARLEGHRPNRGLGFQFAFMDRIMYA